jgi:hypothetical protein
MKTLCVSLVVVTVILFLVATETKANTDIPVSLDSAQTIENAKALLIVWTR